jgi:hypothetical protein
MPASLPASPNQAWVQYSAAEGARKAAEFLNGYCMYAGGINQVGGPVSCQACGWSGAHLSCCACLLHEWVCCGVALRPRHLCPGPLAMCHLSQQVMLAPVCSIGMCCTYTQPTLPAWPHLHLFNLFLSAVSRPSAARQRGSTWHP